MDDTTDEQDLACLSLGVLSRLRMSLQVLAAPAQDQLAHFPDFVCITDEMALEYDHWLARVVESNTISPHQAGALKALNDYLSNLSGTRNSDFWTDEALRHDARWEQVRVMARAGLTAMGWPVDVPPPSPDIYIQQNPDAGGSSA